MCDCGWWLPECGRKLKDGSMDVGDVTSKCLPLQTLLDLGASPDYKDSRGLTPLYHSSMVGGDPYCCELLLHDHALVGCIDENGWQEIHQVVHLNTHMHMQGKTVVE